MKATKVINLCGGPGAGKSTTAYGLMYNLKQRGIECEMVHEVAKTLTWAKHHNVLSCQPKVFGDQLWLIEHLVGQVDYIVVDSPLFLTSIYHDGRYTPFLDRMSIEVFKNNFDNINFLVSRKKKYSPNGRNQTESEAKIIDENVRNILIDNHIPYHTVHGNPAGLEYILHTLGVLNLPITNA